MVIFEGGLKTGGFRMETSFPKTKELAIQCTCAVDFDKVQK